MLILLWLVPPALVTVVAALVVAQIARNDEHRVDRERAILRMGKALADGRPAVQSTTPPRQQDRSTGIAVRRKAS